MRNKKRKRNIKKDETSSKESNVELVIDDDSDLDAVGKDLFSCDHNQLLVDEICSVLMKKLKVEFCPNWTNYNFIFPIAVVFTEVMHLK